MDRARQSQGPSQLHSSRQISRDSSSCAERLRCHGWAERRADHRSHALPLRSASDRLQRRRHRPSVLTPPQIETVKRILSPSRNPRTGEEIYPGLEPGAELGWATLAGPQPFAATTDHFKYVVFKDPNWDWKILNFDSDVALADKIGQRNHQRHRRESEAVLRAKRKAAAVSRMGRSERRAAVDHQLLQARGRYVWAASARPRIPSGFSWRLGMGALRRRRRARTRST